MSLCKAFQNAAKLQIRAVPQPVFAVQIQQTRKISTLLLNHRIHLYTSRTASSVPRRNYWWSKPATAAITSQPESASIPSAQTNSNTEPPQTPAADSTSSTLHSTSSDAALNDAASAAVDSTETFTTNAAAALTPDVSTLSIPPPPLQLGELHDLGFANYTPVGAVQAALELVHVTIGLPWWASIVLVTASLRLVGLHFTIQSARASANMIPIKPKYEALMEEVKAASVARDAVRTQVASLQLRKLQKTHGVSPWKLSQGPLVQMVTSVSSFLAIKKLCDLPLPQLLHEGFSWIPTLAKPDPTYVLPLLCAAMMNIQIRLGQRDVAASGSKLALHFANFFPLLSLLSLAIIVWLPSAVLFNVATNVILMTLQSAFLRVPAVRHKLKLNPLPALLPGQLPSHMQSWLALKAWASGLRATSLKEAERRMQAPPQFPIHSARPAPPTKLETRVGGMSRNSNARLSKKS
ncbi:60Kd inner membrane protein-domain-containing protein [Hysterangium stoloniferum]|nr:60Kd inner membrane protein-domain-containing protein [Hysterangium stoloniferum]